MLARVYLFDAAIEEISHVRIFLCLCHTIIPHAHTGPNFSKHIAMLSRGNVTGRLKVLSYIVKQTNSRAVDLKSGTH